MSYFNPVNKIIKFEKVDFIVPERLREARSMREYPRNFCAKQLDISERELGLYENGHKEIPMELLFGLQNLYEVPKQFFYRVVWERI